MIKNKVMENLFGQMEKNIKENGKIIKGMDLVNLQIKMDLFIKVNGEKIKKMVKVS
jgi:hypothetical protein